MKKVLFLIIVLNASSHAMYLNEEQVAKEKYKKGTSSLTDYQKTRDKMLIENLGVYGFSHLNELTEEQKDERFNERFDLRWYIAYTRTRCLNWSVASVLAWMGTAFCSYVTHLEYTDAILDDQCMVDPERTIGIVICSICGAAMCCAANVSTAVLWCDVCKGLSYGKRNQKEYEQVLQLKMGEKKNE